MLSKISLDFIYFLFLEVGVEIYDGSIINLTILKIKIKVVVERIKCTLKN
tara:strand:+ start:309 stop:458 length:150 start_codon:yes stop_codon:yes gene_type:complete